eukprot:m.123985 g.123985  ORF g.123985 m.123985 type:complete len:167 (+) comp15687_c0_seq26:2215-2715(+)
MSSSDDSCASSRSRRTVVKLFIRVDLRDTAPLSMASPARPTVLLNTVLAAFPTNDPAPITMDPIADARTAPPAAGLSCIEQAHEIIWAATSQESLDDCPLTPPQSTQSTSNTAHPQPEHIARHTTPLHTTIHRLVHPVRMLVPQKRPNPPLHFLDPSHLQLEAGFC